MFCKYCGKEIEDGAAYCPSCGAKVEEVKKEVEEDNILSYSYTSPNKRLHSAGYFGPFEEKMKWYKFIAYFAAYLSGIANIFNGIRYVTGTYLDVSKGLYETYPIFFYSDLVAGIAMIISGIVLIAAGLLLLKMKKLGYRLFIGCYFINLISAIVQIIICLSVIQEQLLRIVLIEAGGISLAVSVAMIIVNYIYFNKRKDIFY